MSDRKEIFERIKKANKGREALPHPGVGKPPKQASHHLLRGDACIKHFIKQAEAQYASTAELPSFADLPKHLEEWLRASNLPRGLVVAPALSHLGWDGDIKIGAPSLEDMVGVSLGVAASAETGSVMMLANEATPTSLNFVPDVEVICISKEDIEAGLEGCWEKLRQWKQKKKSMPRAVNFITGPSRTADIEATMVLGAHGPRRLYVVIINEASLWQKT